MKRKLTIGICLAYSIFMTILAIKYFQAPDEMKKALVAGAGVVLGLIPAVLIKWTKMPLTNPIALSYITFLFGSQYLGTIRHWYGLGWWDTFIHFISGLMLAFIAKTTYEHFSNPTSEAMPAAMKFLFILGFTALGAVIWEIYEFSGDQFFGATMQGGGNFDTMTDLIAGVAGGLVIAVYAGIRKVSEQNS